MRKGKKMLLFTISLTGAVLLGKGETVAAQVVTLDDGTIFDSDFYADTYPDLKQAFGTDANALLDHYLTYGVAEGRKPSQSAVSGQVADSAPSQGLSAEPEQASSFTSRTVMLDDGTVFDADYYANTYPDLKQAYGDDPNLLLDHYLSCGKAEGRKSCATDVFLQLEKLPHTSSSASGDADKDAQAMAVAQQIADQCKEGTDLERIRKAASGVYLLHVLGGKYTNKDKDYRTAYGVLCKGVYTCAGTARAMGMVLECMGYEWLHANPNQYTHQWCIIKMDGRIGWADAMGGVADYGVHPWTTGEKYTITLNDGSQMRIGWGSRN